MTTASHTVFRFAARGLLFCILLLPAACGAVRTPDLSGAPVVDISGEAPDLSVLEALSKGEGPVEPVILKVPEGFSMPVGIAVDTPLATMQSDCGTLDFTRDLFLYISDEGILASPDQQRWADFGDYDAVKELFGGGQGAMSLSLGASQQQNAKLDFKLTVLPKDQ